MPQPLDFFKDYKWDGRDWLLLGKGPSLDTINNFDISNYNVISLNQVCRDRKVHIAFIIDWDVVTQLGDNLYSNCDYLVMPYYPHVGWRAIKEITLGNICQSHPVLSKMANEGRVFGYNLSTIPIRVNDSPVVKARYYSAEAAVNILAKLGVKNIRTLGIDGGNQQSQVFSDLENHNKERGYDLQWKEIRKSIYRYNLQFGPLGVDCPIRIFIGAGNEQLVPALVLKHSILKHATMSVDVTIMNEWNHPMPKDRKNWPRTPFSFQRFMIPEKCKYQGHAIYMDSDMLVFGDVKEIWTGDMDYGQVLVMRSDDVDKHKAKFSVYKINCSQPGWPIEEIIQYLDDGSLTYEQLVFDGGAFRTIRDNFNSGWNSLEEYTEGKTKLLHYTEMYNQPWHANPNHPLGYLWFKELKETISDGSISKELITDHVKRGCLLPKCLEVIGG